MLTETVQNLLNRRKQEKNVIRKPRTNKSHQAFWMERQNMIAQMELRELNLIPHVEELNKIIKDYTFRFVIWDYGTFYSVQVFEGSNQKGEPCVVIGDKTSKMYHSVPMYRRHFKTVNGVKAYIIWYYNNFIRPERELLKRQPRIANSGVEVTYEIKVIELQDAKFKESRAVIFTLDMMLEWQKTKLLPTIQKLFNGKRFNRTVHGKKVIAALEQGKVIRDQKHYIVYWTL
jgi:hypothetical protein